MALASRFLELPDRPFPRNKVSQSCIPSAHIEEEKMRKVLFAAAMVTAIAAPAFAGEVGEGGGGDGGDHGGGKQIFSHHLLLIVVRRECRTATLCSEGTAYPAVPGTGSQGPCFTLE